MRATFFSYVPRPSDPRYDRERLRCLEMQHEQGATYVRMTYVNADHEPEDSPEEVVGMWIEGWLERPAEEPPFDPPLTALDADNSARP